MLGFHIIENTFTETLIIFSLLSDRKSFQLLAQGMNFQQIVEPCLLWAIVRLPFHLGLVKPNALGNIEPTFPRNKRLGR